MVSWGALKRAAVVMVVGLTVAGCAGSPSDQPPIYQSVEEIVALLDDSPFACAGIDVEPVESVLASERPGLVGIANCWEGDTPDPDLTGYHAMVFDSEQNRRRTLVALLAWACMETTTFPYVYGPNWLLQPLEDRTPVEPVEQAAAVVSGRVAEVDCRAFWDAPEDTEPSNFDITWFRTATGEVEFADVPLDRLPEAPQPPAATGLPPTSAPDDGVVADGVLVAVGFGTHVRWPLPDPSAVEITGEDFASEDFVVLERIVATPDGFVAVGWSGAAIAAFSIDGTDWETTELPNGRNVYSVAVGPVGLVAVGGDEDRNPMLWRSDDGRTWQTYDPADRSGTPLDPDYDAEGRIHDIEYVAANQDGYVIVNEVADQARLWFSEDLSTWSTVQDFEGRVYDIVAHQGRFVALVEGIGVESGIWASDDGRSWLQTSPPGQLGLTKPATGRRALASSPKGLLAVTRDSRLALSPDGITWTPIETPAVLADVRLSSVVGGPDGWYIFANIGESDTWGIFFSPDGSNWSRVGSG